MEEYYCCSCAEVIWNPLPFEKLFSQISEHVHDNYSHHIFQKWSSAMRSFLLSKYDYFPELTFCPHCVVNVSLRILNSFASKEDKGLKQFLLTLEGI